MTGREEGPAPLSEHTSSSHGLFQGLQESHSFHQNDAVARASLGRGKLLNPYCNGPPHPSPEGAPARCQDSNQERALRKVPVEEKPGSGPEQGHRGLACQRLAQNGACPGFTVLRKVPLWLSEPQAALSSAAGRADGNNAHKVMAHDDPALFMARQHNV